VGVVLRYSHGLSKKNKKAASVNPITPVKSINSGVESTNAFSLPHLLPQII